MVNPELTRDELIALRRYIRKEQLTNADGVLLSSAAKKIDAIDFDADIKRGPGRPRKPRPTASYTAAPPPLDKTTASPAQTEFAEF